MNHSVYFGIYEHWWYRYDVEADTPEEAYSVAKQLWDDGADPDKEIYDQLTGPYSVEVEDDAGSVLLMKNMVEDGVDNT